MITGACNAARHDNNKLSIFSIIEESTPKQIRMANLCIISSTKVNGVAKIHSNLIIHLR